MRTTWQTCKRCSKKKNQIVARTPPTKLMVVKVRDLRPCDRTIDPSSSSWGRQNQFIGGTKKSGLWMVTVQFVFGSPLVAELRSEQKVKTHVEGQQDQRPPHTQQRDGKRQWELMWRNGLNKQSLRSPAPYYPIIYTAWELGKAVFKTTIAFHWKVACHASCQSKGRALSSETSFEFFRA